MTGQTFKLKPFVPLEQDTKTAILVMMAYHPKVAFAAKFNSGGMSGEYTNKFGRTKKRFIRYNTLDGCPDIMFMIKGGKHGACEVKRQGWTHPTDDHERAQAAHLDLVNAHGGLGFFATSVEEAKARIDAA